MSNGYWSNIARQAIARERRWRPRQTGLEFGRWRSAADIEHGIRSARQYPQAVTARDTLLQNLMRMNQLTRERMQRREAGRRFGRPTTGSPRPLPMMEQYGRMRPFSRMREQYGRSY